MQAVVLSPQFLRLLLALPQGIEDVADPIVPVEHHLLNHEVLALDLIHAAHLLREVKVFAVRDVEAEILAAEYNALVSLLALQNDIPVMRQKANSHPRRNDIDAVRAPPLRQRYTRQLRMLLPLVLDAALLLAVPLHILLANRVYQHFLILPLVRLVQLGGLAEGLNLRHEPQGYFARDRKDVEEAPEAHCQICGCSEYFEYVLAEGAQV